MTILQTLEMALEALENKFLFVAGDGEALDIRANAITALRQALEQQPADEPVACPYCQNSHTLGAVYFDQNCVECVKRMTRPQPAAPVANNDTSQDRVDKTPENVHDEPVAWMSNESAHRLKHGGNSKGAVPVHAKRSNTSKIPLYTTPQPQREWVGLTDEEMVELFEKYGHKTSALLDAHEAKLRELNAQQKGN